MSKKFTEEQYQKIVELSQRWRGNREHKTNVILNYIWNTNLEDLREPRKLDMALAISNPLTREWAHDKFVEKEKKYYWNSIKTELAGHHSRLFRHENGVISTYSRLELANNINEDEQLTESEIREWGYNPDMFDREEVQ